MSTHRPVASASDPFDLDLPASWASEVDGGTVSYRDGRGSVRVTIREFSKNLTLYWWVDVYVRPNRTGRWSRSDVAAGDTFRDPEAAAREAQRIVDAVVDGERPHAAAPASDGGEDG